MFKQIRKLNIILFFIAVFVLPYIVYGQSTTKSNIISEVNILKGLLHKAEILHPDSIDSVTEINDLISGKLIEILSNQSIVNYNLDSLLSHSFLNITHSDDKKLWIFSWYENTGGTYKSNLNIIHYRTPSGHVYSMILERTENTNAGGAAYSRIFTMQKGKQYLLLGGGIGCTTCEYNLALLLSTNDDKYSIDFTHEINYRNGDLSEFEYDTLSQTLKYDYYLEDYLYYGIYANITDSTREMCRRKGLFVYSDSTFEALDTSCYGEILHGKKEGEWVCNYYKDTVISMITSYVHGIQNGKEIRFYSNGKKQSETFYLDGKIHGCYQEWYENGQISKFYTFYDGNLGGISNEEQNYSSFDGIRKEWYGNGNKEIEFQYCKGKPQGIWQKWYEDGKKYFVFNFQKNRFKHWYESGQLSEQFDLKKLEYKHWYEDGKIYSIVHFDSTCNLCVKNFYNGRFQPPFSEKFSGESRCYYKNGNPQSISYTKNGKSIIPYQSWYIDGKKENERIKFGKLIRYMSWYKNGQLKEESYQNNNFKNDSIFNQWYENGQKESEQYYKNGKAEGKFTSWYKNGGFHSYGYKKNDKPDSICSYFYDNNQKELEEYRKNGLLITSTSWDKNGVKWKEVDNNIQVERIWKENGELGYCNMYYNNRKQKEMEYWENGAITFIYLYNNGKLQKEENFKTGIITIWDENGKWQENKLRH